MRFFPFNAAEGFALPLLSHALEQQRRFDGAEAAAKRRKVAGGNRALEKKRGTLGNYGYYNYIIMLLLWDI